MKADGKEYLLPCGLDRLCRILHYSGIAAHKIEKVFLSIEGLVQHYHNSSRFFLEVGHYLQSETTFMKAMTYTVDKGLLDGNNTTLPDSDLELQLNVREGFSQQLGRRTQSTLQVLAFREQTETTYQKPYRSLTN